MGMTIGPGANRKVRPEMNVTPLVDVVLVLLIIFMVVTPLLTKKLWLNIPKDEKTENEPPPPPDAQRPIVLKYQRDGAIRINAQAVPRDELGDRLRRALAARTDGLVFFDADEDADYGRAVEVMDLARGAGASTIAVLTEPVAD